MNNLYTNKLEYLNKFQITDSNDRKNKIRINVQQLKN